DGQIVADILLRPSPDFLRSARLDLKNNPVAETLRRRHAARVAQIVARDERRFLKDVIAINRRRSATAGFVHVHHFIVAMFVWTEGGERRARAFLRRVKLRAWLNGSQFQLGLDFEQLFNALRIIYTWHFQQ